MKVRSKDTRDLFGKKEPQPQRREILRIGNPKANEEYERLIGEGWEDDGSTRTQYRLAYAPDVCIHAYAPIHG